MGWATIIALALTLWLGISAVALGVFYWLTKDREDWH